MPRRSDGHAVRYRGAVMAIRLGYNTNGFPHHTVADAAELLAAAGYDAIAITPDVFHMNPFDGGEAAARALRPRLADLGLAVAVETGARFVLDPARKHRPTLLDAPPLAARRLDYLRRCHAIAVALGAETVSFWSGARPDGVGDDEALDRLCAGASALLDEAGGGEVAVCFEPEPGMAVASLAELDAFLARLGRDELKVMLDVGHVPVTETIPPARAIERLAPRLGGVQLDDSRGGVHEHLALGEGEIDFREIFATLVGVGYAGLACLELPRHDHDPVTTARRAIAFVRERAPARRRARGTGDRTPR